MIKYEFTTKDFTEFNNYYLRNHTSFLRRNFHYYYLLLIGLIMYYSADFFFSKDYWKHADMYSFVPFIVLAFFVIRFSRRNAFGERYARRYVKNNPHAFGHQEITLTEDKLIVQNESAKSEFGYDRFLGLVEVPDYYFVFMSKQAGIVIPKIAITEKSDEELLRTKIKPYTK